MNKILNFRVENIDNGYCLKQSWEAQVAEPPFIGGYRLVHGTKKLVFNSSKDLIYKIEEVITKWEAEKGKKEKRN